MENLNRLIEDLNLHNEILNDMERPFIIMGYVANKIGAIGYKGGIGTGWVTFLMPDNATKFGSIKENDNDYFFEEETEKRWKNYFKVADYEQPEAYHTHYIK